MTRISVLWTRGNRPEERPDGPWRALLAGACAGVALISPATVAAHVQRSAGPMRVTLGWGDAPAIAGAPNFVDVVVADRSGAAVAVPPGSLQVAVSFGSAQRTLPLTASELPGGLRATLVPTDPGTYAFRISGRIRGNPIDVGPTCSPRTFDCVTPASEVRFPARAPSTAEIAQRLEREIPRARKAAENESGDARALASVALALGAVALAFALRALRGGRRGGA